MKLYEVKQMPTRLHGSTLQTQGKALAPSWARYFTNGQEARQFLRESWKALKDSEAPHWIGRLTLNQVEVEVNLKAADWIALLESDAPGTVMTLTPQDLVKDRKPLVGFETKC